MHRKYIFYFRNLVMIEMSSSWETPPLAQFGNGIPHFNFSFHEQSNEFNPYRSSYQEVSFFRLIFGHFGSTSGRSLPVPNFYFRHYYFTLYCQWVFYYCFCLFIYFISVHEIGRQLQPAQQNVFHQCFALP